MEKKIYTGKEFAERYHVARSTLYSWEKQGILRATRIGGRVYYTDDSFIGKKEGGKNENG